MAFTSKEPVGLKFRIDHEYPFNQPQIMYLPESGTSSYAYCKDLLSNILKNQAWGPSFTLPLFLQSLPELAVPIVTPRTI